MNELHLVARDLGPEHYGLHVTVNRPINSVRLLLSEVFQNQPGEYTYLLGGLTFGSVSFEAVPNDLPVTVEVPDDLD